MRHLCQIAFRALAMAAASGGAFAAQPMQVAPAGSLSLTLSSNQQYVSYIIQRSGAPSTYLPPSGHINIALDPGQHTIRPYHPCYDYTGSSIFNLTSKDNGKVLRFHYNEENRDDKCSVRDFVNKLEFSTKNIQLHQDNNRILWIISGKNYNSNWGRLGFVEKDTGKLIKIANMGGYKIYNSADKSVGQILATYDLIKSELSTRTVKEIVVYVSGHGVAMNGDSYFIPINAPSPAQLQSQDAVSIGGLAKSLETLGGNATSKIILTDMCRTKANHSMASAPMQLNNVYVNFSSTDGAFAFKYINDLEEEISVWTDRFYRIAISRPDLSILHIASIANKYTEWESAQTQLAQKPIAFGTTATPSPLTSRAQPITPKDRVARGDHPTDGYYFDPTVVPR